MLLEFTVYGITKSDLGWIIGKHPDNSYENQPRKGNVTTVFGKWLPAPTFQAKESEVTFIVEGEEKKQAPTTEKKEKEKEVSATYSLRVFNQPTAFMEMLRSLNWAAYVHSQLAAVCPYNLTPIREALRSPINKNYPENSKGDQEFMIEAVLGPWTVPLASVARQFERVGISVLPVTDERYQNSYLFRSDLPMTLTEFLRKLIVIAFAMTRKLEIVRMDKNHLLSFEKLWDGWDNLPTVLRNLKPREEKSVLEKPLTEATMHEKRHMVILNWLKSTYDNICSIRKIQNLSLSILDLGSAEGSLVLEMANVLPSNTRFIAMDASINWPKRVRSKKQIKLIKQNFLYPLSIYKKHFDILVMCEVIEHLVAKDRKKLMKIVTQLLRPQHVCITSPNIEFNKNIPKLTEAGFRHEDHKIEYTYAEWTAEIIVPLKEAGYQITEHSMELLGGSSVLTEQPTFMVTGILTENKGEKEKEKEKEKEEEKKDQKETGNVEKEQEKEKGKEKEEGEKGVEKDQGTQKDKEIEKPKKEGGKPKASAKGKGKDSGKQKESPVEKKEEKEGKQEGEEEEEEEEDNGLEDKEEFKKKKRDQVRDSLVADLEKAHEPIWLQDTQYLISKKDVKMGMTSFEFLQNSNHQFFAAPTIAPCDYMPNKVNKPELLITPKSPGYIEGEVCDYLEHPEAAFAYFRLRGITEVYCEKKYMGSRGHLLVYRDPSMIKFPPFYTERRGKLNAPPITLLTRNGNPFFTPQDVAGNALLDKWYGELKVKMEEMKLDWLMLDGEVLPWSLKADSLIESEFKGPGRAAYEARLYSEGPDAPSTIRAKRFLDVLEWFSGSNEKPTFRCFTVLGAGVLQTKNSTIHVPKYMGHYMQSDKHYALLKSLETESIRSVEYMKVNLDIPEEVTKAIFAWDSYTTVDHGEGWVIKISPSQMAFFEDGRPILPFLKVRGREYLRIIYGIDYLIPENFTKVTNRRIGPKRQLSNHQHELSLQILKMFFRSEHRKRVHLLAGFYGMDFKLDRTL